MAEYTKGEWEKEGIHINVFGRGIVAITPNTNDGGVLERVANANLIASAPRMHTKLRSCDEELTKVQDIVVEIAKTCSPDHAEMLVVAQSYLCRVIKENEEALAKAEG